MANTFSIFGNKSTVNVPNLICLQIETGAKIWYLLSHRSGAIEEITDEAYVPDAPYLSLTTDDLRFETTVKLNRSNAKSLIERNFDTLGTAALVINNSAKGVVYGTTATRMAGETAEALPSPMIMLADDYLRRLNKTSPVMLGIVFKENTLAILLAYTSTGKVQFQVALSSDNLQATAYAFSAHCGLTDDVEIIYATKEDVFNGVRTVPPYPLGGGLAALNLNKILPAISRLSVAGAIGLGCWGYYLNVQLTEVDSQIISEKAKDSESQSKNAELFKNNPTAIAQMLSADWKKGFDDVGSLYVDGSVAESFIDTQSVTHTIITAFKTGNRKGLVDLVSDNLITETLNKATPDGCRRVSVEFSGGLNEVKSKYSCVGAHNNLSRFGF